MRKPSQSNTLRGAVLALASAVVALVVGVLTMVEVLSPAQAAVVTGLVAPVIGAVGALWAAWGRYNPDIQPLGKPGGGSGPGAVLAVLAVLGLSLAGCGHTFRCKDSYVRNLTPVAPFADNAVCDGEEVFKASGPMSATMVVRCPEGQTPAYTPAGAVTCREVAP